MGKIRTFSIEARRKNGVNILGRVVFHSILRAVTFDKGQNVRSMMPREDVTLRYDQNLAKIFILIFVFK